ncbi:MAG TPA: sugar transferase [Arachnia sp.]|nr:sugar transferase [Arachnia sp.]HMT85205.1 sugar transferase [Arachnia sp.]
MEGPISLSASGTVHDDARLSGLDSLGFTGTRASKESAEGNQWWAIALRDGTRPLFVASDVAALVFAGLLSPSEPLLALLFGVTLIACVSATSLYRSRLNQSTLDDLPKIALAWLVASALMVISGHLVGRGPTGLLLSAYTLILIVVLRAIATLCIRQFRRSGAIAHPTVIVGADQTGRLIASKIASNPQYGLRTIGFLDDEGVEAEDLKMLGGPKDLVRVLKDDQPRALIIAHSHLDDEQLVGMVRECHRNRCELLILPRLYEISNLGEDTDYLAGIPLIRLRRRAYRTWGWVAKRVMDLVLSLLALVVLSPLLAVIAVAVRIEGGPGIIFRQKRVSVDGSQFDVLKFRSMRPANENESQTQWNIAKDDRVGPVGRFLRKSSLDELPQLWNIVRGDMSIVGPRPERPYYVDQFIDEYDGYEARHRVPCGLTGWAQVHGLRGDTSIEERAQFDNFYIENWSLWLDVKIILMTIPAVFSKPGA